MANSIPKVKVGNEIFDVKDLTAREHLVEVNENQPSSPDNKLWIKEMENDYLVPEYAEFEAVRETVERLDVPVLTEEELDEICDGGGE